tara:strand:+ start:329 stop:1198 length:870 start_codon:yes stop_codon:yes gene_type:complete
MITINASEIAALVGKNPYKDPEEAIQDLLNRNVHKTPDTETQRTLEICKDDKDAQRLHQEMVARARHTKSSEEAARVKTEYHQKIEGVEKSRVAQIGQEHDQSVKKIDEEFEKKTREACTRGQKLQVQAEKADAIIEVQSQVMKKTHEVQSQMTHMKNVGTRKTNTSFGTRHEGDVGEMYHKQTGLRIEKDNARKFWEFMPGFGIVGRFDGFNEEGTLVEIKNRMRRLFGTVVEYEKVQVHVYMAMSRKTQAQLVERYQDQIMVHEVEFDQQFMDGVLDELKDICKSYF